MGFSIGAFISTYAIYGVPRPPLEGSIGATIVAIMRIQYRALIITYTILGVPHYIYSNSIFGPETLF